MGSLFFSLLPPPHMGMCMPLMRMCQCAPCVGVSVAGSPRLQDRPWLKQEMHGSSSSEIREDLKTH